MNSQTIGTCSLCGGPVTLPLAWYSVTPPVATCSRCGAVQAQHGPVIPMVRPADIPGPFTVPIAPSTGTSPGLTIGYGPEWTVDVTTDTVTLDPRDIGGPGWSWTVSNGGAS